MGSSRITIDSHALIWYIDELLNDKLSDKALEAIIQAEKNGIIYVPMISLLEILRLYEKGKLSLSFEDILSRIEGSENYEVVPFDMELLKISVFVKDLELHDRLIVATAVMTNTDIISMDRSIRAKSFGTSVIW